MPPPLVSLLQLLSTGFPPHIVPGLTAGRCFHRAHCSDIALWCIFRCFAYTALASVPTSGFSGFLSPHTGGLSLLPSDIWMVNITTYVTVALTTFCPMLMVSRKLLAIIIGCEVCDLFHAFDIWKCLEHRFNTASLARVLDLKHMLTNLSKDDH